MSRSAEDILLQVRHVKHKKNDGTLYIMGERMAWMASHKSDTFGINHKYVDIKSQKISPEGKAKIQLQIVLHDGTSTTTFHFNDPLGKEVQIKQRDDVKELLQQLLPKFKRKMNKELEEKNRMLSDNPALFQLYKDLVITNILSPDEFWTRHSTASSSKSSTSTSGQEVGVSGSFLSDIKPQADGANGLKYNLTADIIESIFKTYPAVKRKHVENVPASMTEQEFWTKFFQSHYFHRDRIHAKGGVKDIFTECAKDDDNTIKAQLKSGVGDPVANIHHFSDKSLHESFGGSDSSKHQHGGPINLVHQNIIKRFNQHSIMVMKANNSDETGTDGHHSRKRLRDKVHFEDLSEAPFRKVAKLKLAKTERYLMGPTPSTSNEDSSSGYLSKDELFKWNEALAKELDSWSRGSCLNVLSARNAVAVLNDLSPGGALMKASRQELLAGQYPESVQTSLKQLYGSLAELLRHFWACFFPTPPTSTQMQEKAVKMHETLKKFQLVKLRHFENELARQDSSGPRITAHINQMLEAADRKFSTWQQNMNRMR